MKNVKNELYKLWKGRRLGIFLLILFVTCIAMGVLVSSIQMKGLLEKDVIDSMTGGNFPTQVLGMIADIVLPVFATLVVTFLVKISVWQLVGRWKVQWTLTSLDCIFQRKVRASL